MNIYGLIFVKGGSCKPLRPFLAKGDMLVRLMN